MPSPSLAGSRPTVLMLLTNAYEPDPRVRQEALALIRNGCRVRILAWDRDRRFPPSECLEQVDVDRVFLDSTHGRGALQIFFYAVLYCKLFWRAFRTPFDVIHCHDLDTLPAGFVLGKLRRRPIVYDSHESFTCMLTGSVPAPVRSALIALENFLIRRVDLLITVGDKLRRHFAGRGARRTVVVGNWKRLSEFVEAPGASRELRRTLGIPPEAFVVVCITQLLPDRKLEEFLDAVDAVPGVYAIVGGSGKLEPMVRARALRNDRIKYAGFVKAKDIPVHTCASDAVYYGFDPSNPNARFSAPNKLFEALAAGLPIVTGDFGEIGELVRTAGCGIVLNEYSLAEVSRALITLSNRDARQAMGEKARRLGESSFNWERAEKVLCSEYASLVGTLPGPATALTRTEASADV